MSDISDQMARIRSYWLSSTNAEQRSRNYNRYRRADAAAYRYAENIGNQRRFSNAWYSGPRRTAEDLNAAMRRADSIRFSRRTYMGLNNG